MIIFGKIFGGKVHKVDDQWIETSYLMIMAPLIPLETMFVTNSEFNRRQGFSIAMNGKSVLHGYIRFFTFIATIGLFGFSFFGRHEISHSIMYSPALYGTLFGAIYIWSRFKNTEASLEEIIQRKAIGAITGLNALPEWLPVAVKNHQEENLKKLIEEKFSSEDIKSIALKSFKTPQELMLIFTYLRFVITDKNKAIQYKTEYEFVLNEYAKLFAKSESQSH